MPVPASATGSARSDPSAQAAIALIKQIGIIPEWDEDLDRYFHYELREVEGGVTPSSDRGAVLEDLGYGNAMYWSDRSRRSTRYGPRSACRRCCCAPAREILPGFGFILPAPEAERFAAAVSSAHAVDIDANHYMITTHDDSIGAIGAFLRVR